MRYESALPDSVCCCIGCDDVDEEEEFGLVMIICYQLPIDDCNNDDGMMMI